MLGAKEGRIELRDGASLAYSTTGSGDPVVMVHSLGYNRSLFQRLATGLGSYRVVTYDLRGHGASSLGDVPPSLGTLADDLEELLGTLRIRTAHYLGQSIGGMILLETATRDHLQGTLTLLDTLGWTDSAWSERYQARIVEIEKVGIEAIAEGIAEVSLGSSTRARCPTAVASYAAQLRSTPAPGYIWSCRAMQSFDLRPLLKPTTHLPTRVAAGEQDNVTPLAHARILADLIGAEPAVPIPDSGHLPVLENPTFVLDLVRGFWQQHRLGRSAE